MQSPAMLCAMHPLLLEKAGYSTLKMHRNVRNSVVGPSNLSTQHNT